MTFDALAEKVEQATVTVTDNTGAAHEVVATDLAAGATFAQFNFVTAIEGDLEGVWTVNNASYDFDDLSKAAAIVKAANDENQVQLLSLLNEAGLEGVDADNIVKYQDDIKTATDKETLADIQVIITKSNEDAGKVADKAVAVKAVKEAKNQVQLLNALQDGGFERVNSAWASAYAGGKKATADIAPNLSVAGFLFTAAGSDNTIVKESGKDQSFDAATNEVALSATTATAYDEIQAIVDQVNLEKIIADNEVADTAAKQAAVTALVEKWVEADEEGDTDKADMIEASNIKVAAFNVVEATTQVNLYNALVALANASDDLDIKDLNANLRADYLVELDASTVRATQKAAIVGNDIDDSGSDVQGAVNSLEAAIVTAADSTALGKAETGVYALTANSTNAQIKAALQRLADVTAHETGADKFDMSTVREDQLKNYVTVKDTDPASVKGFATATTKTLANAKTIIEKVNGVIAETDALKTINNTNSTAVDVRAALLELALITIEDTTPAGDGAVEEAQKFVNLSPQARLEVAEFVIDARKLAGAGSTNDFTLDAIIDQDATTGNGAGELTDAILAHSTKFGKFNAIGNLASATTTKTQAALADYGYKAYTDLSTVKKIAVAEEINKLTKKDADGNDVSLDFGGTDKVTTLKAANEIIDAAITRVAE